MTVIRGSTVLPVHVHVLLVHVLPVHVHVLLVHVHVLPVHVHIGSLSDFPDLREEEGGGRGGGGGGVDVPTGVPIACAGGEVIVRVKIKGCDSAPGPKLDVDVFVGVVHLLVSPQQLHTLLEMVLGLSGSSGTCTLYVYACSLD